MTIQKRLGDFGSRFAFEFFVELMHDGIINGLRKYLSEYSPQDIQAMVRENRFPPLEHLGFSMAGDHVKHLERISLVRLVEYLAEARPDLASAIQDMGRPGAEYLARVHQHILGLIKHPEKPLAETTAYEPKEKMKLATCDQCGKSWPIPEDEAAAIKECPFCHT